MGATPDSAPIPFGHLRRFWFSFTAFLPHGLGGGPLRPMSSFPWSPFLLGLWQSKACPSGARMSSPSQTAPRSHIPTTPPVSFLFPSGYPGHPKAIHVPQFLAVAIVLPSCGKFFSLGDLLAPRDSEAVRESVLLGHEGCSCRCRRGKAFPLERDAVACARASLSDDQKA